jgi:hypothetical protein
VRSTTRASRFPVPSVSTDAALVNTAGAAIKVKTVYGLSLVIRNIPQVCSLSPEEKSVFSAFIASFPFSKRFLLIQAVYSFAIRPAILTRRCKYCTFNGLRSPEFIGIDNLDDGKSV